MREPTIRQRLRFFFERSGLSQEALGRKIGIRGAAVNQWLAGKTAPRHGRIPRICRALGISVARFYGPLVEETPEAHP